MKIGEISLIGWMINENWCDLLEKNNRQQEFYNSHPVSKIEGNDMYIKQQRKK